jgi:hypothetical protein
MASTKRFTTGGGFPGPDSPGRQIEFTLSYGQSQLYDPTATETGNAYGHRIEFSDPEDAAYVCAMYGPPRDEVGLRAFRDALTKAHDEVAHDPAYTSMPVPPLKFTRWYTAEDKARDDIGSGPVAQSCLWARQFAPGTNVSINLPRDAGANGYRVQERDKDNRLVTEHSGFANPIPTGASFDVAGLPSWMRNALAYRPQGEPADVGSSDNDSSPASDDPRNIRVLRRVAGL